MPYYEDILEKVETLQNILVSFSTGGQESDPDYRQLRSELLNDSVVGELLPRFLRTCRNLNQFWQFIKREFAHYSERRSFLWSEFGPIIDMLESRLRTTTPSDVGITETLSRVDSDTVHESWRTALARRFDDPDGAITAARSLVETVCKHILDGLEVEYNRDISLPDLYRLTSEALVLAPSQHTDQIMKRTLGGIVTTVQGIGSLRNILGDAHGRGIASESPEVYHAELAVNLAGALSTFLISCWESQRQETI